MHFEPEKMKMGTARRAVLRMLELGQAGARSQGITVRHDEIPVAHQSYRRKSS
jgi:hypothetical protein